MCHHNPRRLSHTNASGRRTLHHFLVFCRSCDRVLFSEMNDADADADAGADADADPDFDDNDNEHCLAEGSS